MYCKQYSVNDIRAQTCGRETFGRRRLGADIWAQRHLGAKTFGPKTFGREMRCSALFTIIFYYFQKILYTPFFL